MQVCKCLDHKVVTQPRLYWLHNHHLVIITLHCSGLLHLLHHKPCRVCCAGPSLPPEVNTNLQMGNWSPALEGWFRTILNSAPLPAPEQAYMALLGDCHTALSIVRDVGFEAALQHLGRQCIAAAAPCDKANYHAATDEPEVDPSVSQLLKDLAEHVCSLVPVLQALESGHNSAHIGFPKLQTLISFLSDMNAKETAWHGIVFVKERQSVHTLTHMLQQVPDFANEVSFHPFTGHGHQKQQQVTVGSFSRRCFGELQVW